MKKWMSMLAIMLAMVLVLAACGAQESKDAATEAPSPAPTDTPAPTEPPKTEEELILERDTAAVKLSIDMVKTMMATAAEKEAAEPEGSKVARYYGRISRTSVDKPFRAIILTPTDAQFQQVKTMVNVDAEYKLATALAKFLNLMNGVDYAEAAENVSTEADASAVGENVIVLLPCEDVVVVSIHDGKAQSSMIWGTGDDFLPDFIPSYAGQIGIKDLGFRNYDGETLKTMMGQ